MVNVERQGNCNLDVFTSRVRQARKKDDPECGFVTEHCIKRVIKVKERFMVSRRANLFIGGHTQYPIAPIVQLCRRV